MDKQDDIQLVEAFAGELWQATMIQQMLEDNQIKAFLENELMGTIAPWRVAAGGFDPVKVIISGSNYDQAIKLIEDFNNSEAVDDDE